MLFVVRRNLPEQWTQARVKKVIEREFGVIYHQNYISRLLDDLGWSVQKPVSRAIERDEDLIRAWLSRLAGDALGVRQVFFLSGGVTAFAGLLAAVLMRPPAAALPIATEAGQPGD